MPTNNASPIVYLAIELSSSTWVVACRQPWNEKVKLHRMDAGDCGALLSLISALRRQAVAKFGVDAIIASCFEAGRDGFWLHRLLLAHDVINHVLEPTSILVTRGARRAKTDQLDALGLLRVLAATFTGDHDACRVVKVPAFRKRTENDRIGSANISSRNGSVSKTASPPCWRRRASRKGRPCAHGRLRRNPHGADRRWPSDSAALEG